MSHNIKENDRIESIESTWHKLEELKELIVFEGGALDYQVEAQPIFYGNNQGEQFPIEGYKAIVRPDLNLTLNVCKDSYEIIQNSRVWESINNSLAGLNYQIVTAGSLGNCQKVFICVKLLDSENYVVNKDQFKNFMVFTSSHDGSLAFNAYDTSIRVVCQNTLQWSMLEKGILNFKVYHSKNSEIRIQGMEAEIEKLLIKREEFYSSMKYLMEKPMSGEKADLILSGWLSTDKLSTRACNQKERILELFQSGKGNNGETVYDLFNGVTEYYTHESGKGETKQYSSSEFGTGARKKVEFAEIAFDDNLLEKLAKRGEVMLKARELELAK
jgi:phage/plasmid-like protein (TIGR03299 family)